jgi:hypothetical protein
VSLPLPWVIAPGEVLRGFTYPLFGLPYVIVGLWSLWLSANLARIENRERLRGLTILAWISLVLDLFVVTASNGWEEGRELGGGEGFALIGLIVVLVGSSRAKRARERHQPTPTQPPPPGWYRDSQAEGARWWDGQRWTEHRQT